MRVYMDPALENMKDVNFIPGRLSHVNVYPAHYWSKEISEERFGKTETQNYST